MTSDRGSERTAEQERLRGYLLSQGEKYSWLELWRRVTPARMDLLSALDDVTEEQAAFTPAPDDWSIAEVATHIASSSRSVAATVQALAIGERPPGRVAVEPPRAPVEATIAELREDLLESGQQFAGLSGRLPEPPNMDATAPHAFFGDLTCKAWYLFQRVHDGDHMQQIEAVKQAPGYPGGV